MGRGSETQLKVGEKKINGDSTFSLHWVNVSCFLGTSRNQCVPISDMAIDLQYWSHHSKSPIKCWYCIIPSEAPLSPNIGFITTISPDGKGDVCNLQIQANCTLFFGPETKQNLTLLNNWGQYNNALISWLENNYTNTVEGWRLSACS